MALGQLHLGEPFLVLAAGRDERMDQRVAGLGQVVELQTGDLPGRTEVVARVAHLAQQADRRHGGVEADGVADPAVLGRVCRQHQHDLAVARRDVAQAGVGDRDAGDAGAALGVSDVARQAVLVDLLEREGCRDDATVELGDRDLVGRVERGDAVVGRLPVLAARGQAQALQDRDVERLHALDVPRLVVAAGADGAGLGATGREHRDDQRVELGQLGEQLVGCSAQRRGEDRHAVRLAGRVDRVRELVRECAVAGRLVRSVIQDADLALRSLSLSKGLRGFDRLNRRSGCDPPFRQHCRRLEAHTGQQHRVGQEAVQLAEVGRAALGEVAVRLRCGAHRDSRVAHQLGVRRLLAAEHDDGNTRGQHRVEAVAPRARGAEDAYDDEVGAIDRRAAARWRRRAAQGWRARSRRRSRGRTAGRCRTWTAARCASCSSSGFSPRVVGCSTPSVWLA